MSQSDVILPIRAIDQDDSDTAGSEAVRLSQLARSKLSIPDGFVISTAAYYRFLKENFLTTKINHLLGTVNYDDPHSLLQVASHINKLFLTAPFPEELQREITSQYRRLGGTLKDPQVLLSISGTTNATQSPTTIQKYIHGDTALVLGIKTVWASHFEAKALFYRHREQSDHFRGGIALLVQALTSTEVSGSIYTASPKNHDKNELIIEAVFGLSEILNTEKGLADRYMVNKSDLTILEKITADQEAILELINGEIHHAPVRKGLKQQQKLSDEEIIKLSQIARSIEQIFYYPQHILWHKSDGHFVITATTDYHGDPERRASPEPLISGASGSGPITSGKVKIISQPKDIASVSQGDILVTERISSELAPAIKKAAGVITEKPIDTASLLKLRSKMAVPFISGVKKARQLLRSDQIVTVNGRAGTVSRGGPLSPVPLERKHTRSGLATKLYIAVTGNTTAAIASLPSDTVCVTTGDALIEAIGVHPKKMLRDGKAEQFSRELAERLTVLSQAANPRPLMYSMSNLTTDRYRKLSGGKTYEPTEENPHLGYYGGIRALHDPEVFALELTAIARVRNMLQGKNLWLMLPIARTPQEFFRVKKLVTASGLYRSSSFQIWFRLALPANVIRLEEFLRIGIDGVMIDSERLAELFLGTDNRNPEVSHMINYDDEALHQACDHIIKTCHKHEVASVFSGRTPSSSFLKQLISGGISGLSVEPYALENVRKSIYNYERQLVG